MLMPIIISQWLGIQNIFLIHQAYSVKFRIVIEKNFDIDIFKEYLVCLFLVLFLWGWGDSNKRAERCSLKNIVQIGWRINLCANFLNIYITF